MKNYPLHHFDTTFLYFFKKIKKSLLLVLFFSLFSNFGNEMNAQLNTNWHKIFGGLGFENFIDVQPTLDSNYMVLAYDNKEFWILKLEKNGNLIWQRKYGGNVTERPYAFDMRPDGGAIIVGGTNSSESGDVSGVSNGGGFDGWVVAINDIGDIEWERNIGGSGDDYFRDVKITSDGGFILLGQSKSADGDIGVNYGDYDLFVTKLDASGATEWIRNYGGSNEDYPVSIHQIGAHYLIGADTHSSDGDVSTYYDFQDFWILEIGETGNIVLEKTLGGFGFETLYDLKPTSDGGLVCLGIVGSESLDGGGSVSWKNLVVKLDANQNIEWEKEFDDKPEKVNQTPDGKYLVLDIYSHLFQLNEFGEQEWEYEILLTPEEERLTKNFNLIDDKIMVVGVSIEDFFGVDNYNGIVIQLETGMITPPSSPCPNDLTDFTTLGEFGGSKYYISNDISKATDAQLVAEANGGNLVVIDSQEENDFIQQNISEMVYIGLQDFDTEGTLSWVNGEAVNYNNINPCAFCEANSDDQDFVIMQPWDGAWSFSNFYNQRKYVIEVVCDSSGTTPTPPTSDTTGCYFISTFSYPSMLPINQCMEETPSGFRWYSAETTEYYDQLPNPPLMRNEVEISTYGNVINNFQETFTPPPFLTIIGISKKEGLAYVLNESTEELSVCNFNWQELWSVPIPGIASNYLIEFLNVSETEDELMLIGIRNEGSGDQPFLMVLDKYSGAIKANIQMAVNLFESSHVVKGMDGNYYVFGTDAILKIDPATGFVWQNYFSNSGDQPTFSGETPDGSAIFARLFYSQSPVIAMFDAISGFANWEKDLNNILPIDRVSDNNFSLSATPTLDGGIIIGLNTNSIATGSDPKFYLAKLDQNGEVIWDREYDESYQYYALQLATSDGGYILTQRSAVNQTMNFLKLNSIGLEEPTCGAASLPDLEANNLFIDDYTNSYAYTVNENNASDSLVFSFERANIGMVNSGNYDIGFYLSDDSNFDANDELIYILSDQNSQAQTNFESFESIKIPSTTPTGFYYLIGVVDNQDNVFELLENNNVAVSHGFEVINFGNTNSPCADVIPGFTLLGEYGGSNYYLSEETAQPVAAQVKAEEINGYLAAVNTQAENDFIADQLTEMVYIGLNDFTTEEELEWGTNTPVNYTNFDICNFCNDNTPDMDFVVMHSWNGGWSWSNFYNSRKYVVEVPCPMIMIDDPINNVLISILSESEAKERAIHLEKIYPNPAEEFIFTQIKSTVEEDVELLIYDAIGVLVKSQKVNLTRGENKIRMNINDLSKGIYSIFIPKANEGFTTLRFVK